VGGDERDDQRVEALQLSIEELSAPRQLAQRDPGGVTGDLAGAGPQRSQIGNQGRRSVPREAGSQLIGPGHDQRPGLIDRLGSLGAGAALGDHQRPDRLDRAVAAFRCAGSPAGQGGAGGADGVQRVGLALPPAVLSVAAIHLDDPDPGGGHMPGQAGTVTAGPFHPDQVHGPEPAQPTQQTGVAGRGRRELFDAEQPSNRVKRRSDMHVRMGVDTAGHDACFYDGQRHPFLG
jgi:hypothetical protein